MGHLIMKTLFIIPCAIMIGDEKAEHLDRFFQLLHTIDSITSRFKDPEIRIYELSGKTMYPLFYKQLESCRLVTTQNDSKVLNIKETAKDVNLLVTDEIRPIYEKGYIKNATESLIISRVLDEIDPTEFDRVFKITGRYFFTPSFSISNHNTKGKITLKDKSKCHHGKKYTMTDSLRHCICWSYCTSIHEQVRDRFRKIHEYIIDHANGKGIASIENGLVLFFEEDLVNSVKSTGCAGKVDGRQYHFD